MATNPETTSSSKIPTLVVTTADRIFKPARSASAAVMSFGGNRIILNALNRLVSPSRIIVTARLAVLTKLLIRKVSKLLIKPLIPPSSAWDSASGIFLATDSAMRAKRAVISSNSVLPACTPAAIKALNSLNRPLTSSVSNTPKAWRNPMRTACSPPVASSSLPCFLSTLPYLVVAACRFAVFCFCCDRASSTLWRFALLSPFPDLGVVFSHSPSSDALLEPFSDLLVNARFLSSLTIPRIRDVSTLPSLTSTDPSWAALSS